MNPLLDLIRSFIVPPKSSADDPASQLRKINSESQANRDQASVEADDLQRYIAQQQLRLATLKGKIKAEQEKPLDKQQHQQLTSWEAESTQIGHELIAKQDHLDKLLDGKLPTPDSTKTSDAESRPRLSDPTDVVPRRGQPETTEAVIARIDERIADIEAGRVGGDVEHLKNLKVALSGRAGYADAETETPGGRVAELQQQIQALKDKIAAGHGTPKDDSQLFALTEELRTRPGKELRDASGIDVPHDLNEVPKDPKVAKFVKEYFGDTQDLPPLDPKKLPPAKVNHEDVKEVADAVMAKFYGVTGTAKGPEGQKLRTMASAILSENGGDVEAAKVTLGRKQLREPGAVNAILTDLNKSFIKAKNDGSLTQDEFAGCQHFLGSHHPKDYEDFVSKLVGSEGKYAEGKVPDVQKNDVTKALFVAAFKHAKTLEQLERAQTAEHHGGFAPTKEDYVPAA